MKKEEWNEGLDHIAPDIIEDYIEQKDKLKQKKKIKGILLRIASATCAAVLVGALAVAMLNRGKPVVDPPDDDAPSVSVMTSGNEITGKQELLYGEPSAEGGANANMLAPCFEIQTVIEAQVIEVLPDTYYYADSYYEPFHIARLRVVDQIRGDGLPKEIFLCYPYYDTSVFDGYERFIMSLEQVGVDNYALVNGTQGRVDYFSNMFEVCVTRDLGYGSVIAFNDGKVDDSFWEKTDYLVSKVPVGKGVFDNMIASPSANYYPASRNSDIAKVKSNIIKLANDEDNWHVSSDKYDYVTADDVFISDEARAIRSYLEPTDSNVFTYYLTLREDRVIANYTRIINGFRTDETICINGYTSENGNVSTSGVRYTEDDLAKIPNIGEALENMDLSSLTPPHIEVTAEMSFSHSKATGIYRKVNGEVYGVVRVLWYYKYSNVDYGYIMDDMYYLYDVDGNGKTLERDQLKEVIGDDHFIKRFAYDCMIAWD